MARVLVCFHTSADPDVLSDSEWINGCASGRIDVGYLKKTWGCFDESALELACRFRERAEELGEKCGCAAVTADDKSGDAFLGTLAALGFTQTDRICLKDDDERAALSSERLAALLFSYIKRQEPFDLILAGSESTDGGQGKVPLLLAELLGIRCITQVTDLKPSDDGRVHVSYYRDDALCKETVSCPGVFVAGNCADTYLRVPTLKQRMLSREQPIGVYDTEELQTEADAGYGSEVVLCAMEPNIQKREAIKIDLEDPRESAVILYEYYRKWGIS